MSVVKKFFLYILLIFVTIVALALKDELFPEKKTVETKNSQSSEKNTKPENIKVLPAAIVLQEYSKNKLRASEKYGASTLRVVAVFHQVQNDKFSNGKEIFITMMESWDGGLMYAVLPQSERNNVINIDNGTLISIDCNGIEQYGSSPLFKKCDSIKKIDTNGERPKIYLDKLIWDNNELVNPK